MKRKHLFFVALTFFTVLTTVSAVTAQQLNYEYDYDNAGNRIKRGIVRLENRRNDEDRQETHLAQLTDSLFDGNAIRIFPNPTEGIVRLEVENGTVQFKRFRLFDLSGRLIDEGTQKESSLRIDLSGEPNGTYILEVWLEDTQRSYKIIKQ